jgi:hypothetical protein
MLVAERDAVLSAAHKGLLGPDTLAGLLADIDARRDSEAGHASAAPQPPPTAVEP